MAGEMRRREDTEPEVVITLGPKAKPLALRKVAHTIAALNDMDSMALGMSAPFQEERGFHWEFLVIIMTIIGIFISPVLL